MKIFTSLYEKALRLSAKPQATIYLYALSLFEAIIIPVPPDVMLAPMCATQPERAIRLAFFTTIFSVGGGVIGYALGLFAMGYIEPWLVHFGWNEEYAQVREWFAQWGIAIILIAGFSPIPYKVFTLAAGAMYFSLPLFIVFSFVGRAGRFFLIALILRRIGPAMLPRIHRLAEQIGWLTIFALIVFLTVYYL